MKKYNHSLDFTVLALASAADGDFSTAGKLLVKASKAHDVKDAVAILEASNAQAFANQVKASKTATKAAKRVKASTQVRAFDIGDEDEINELIEDEDVADADEDGAEDEDDDTEVDADADEDEDDEDFEAQFASMLKGMKGAAKPKR